MIFLVAASLGPSPALAHQMYVFAEADGAAIHGQAYFRGGAPARDVAITAFDPSGEELARATTDEDGKFALEAGFRCDHRLLAQTADGHGAEFTVTADQLPKDLPPRGEVSGAAEKPPDAVAIPQTSDRSNATSAAEQRESLRSEIVQLRKELRAYQEQTRLRDVLGGIGWIVGIAGVAFYFLGLRRKPNPPAT